MPQATDDRLATTFRDGMAHMCAPVTIITAMDDTRPHGTTVSAVMSLSMDPPLIAVALAHTSESLGLIKRTNRFGVNILSAAQHPTAIQFAGKGQDKFLDVPWTEASGLPRINNSAIWIDCTAASFAEAGDHLIVVGSVQHVETDTDLAPLTYHGRRFGTHVPVHNQNPR
jgi:flavin reductase (DIM6/NTAB) family NADH-FMN oxidoreductase RutF